VGIINQSAIQTVTVHKQLALKKEFMESGSGFSVLKTGICANFDEVPAFLLK
jgi:hypothetical protein